MKILVVEDNKKLADTIKKGLELEGFAADCVYDGIAAESRILVNSNQYDLVVLDRMLPGKEGIEVCKSWREAEIITPVLMLTARDSITDRVEGLDAGADDYLIKPFDFEELLARIRALLRRPKNITENILEAHDIELNTNEHKVTRNGKVINLTLKEFMVLEYLMQHPHQAVARDTLYDHAWDFADSTFSNTVDVHIKNLRKKLNDDGKLIQTVRGMGYKLEA